MMEISLYARGQAVREPLAEGINAAKSAASSTTNNPREELLNRKLEEHLAARIDNIRRQMGPAGAQGIPEPGSILDIRA